MFWSITNRIISQVYIVSECIIISHICRNIRHTLEWNVSIFLAVKNKSLHCISRCISLVCWFEIAPPTIQFSSLDRRRRRICWNVSRNRDRQSMHARNDFARRPPLPQFFAPAPCWICGELHLNWGRGPEAKPLSPAMVIVISYSIAALSTILCSRTES